MVFSRLSLLCLRNSSKFPRILQARSFSTASENPEPEQAEILIPEPKAESLFPATFPGRVMIIKPQKFQSNPGESKDNTFIKNSPKLFPEICRVELNNLEKALESYGITIASKQNNDIKARESYYAGDWFAAFGPPLTDAKLLFLLPMKNDARKRERRKDLVKYLETLYPTVIDLTFFEESDLALEGAGSFVLDTKNRQVFMSVSHRSSETVLNEMVRYMNYGTHTSDPWKPVIFRASDQKRFPIHHTNLILSFTSDHAVLNLAAIDSLEVERVKLALTGYEIIDVGHPGMFDYAASFQTLYSPKKLSEVVFMSKTAKNIVNLQGKEVCYVDVSTIEMLGGGSIPSLLGKLY